MNRNISIFVVCAFLLFWAGSAFGCLSNTINIGLLNNDESRLLAELTSLTIGERTGTNVRLLIFQTREEFTKALTIENRDDRIDLTVENLKKIIQTAKSSNTNIIETEGNTDTLDKNESISFIQKSLVLNNLDGKASGSFVFYRNDLLKDYPLLPRLLNKLSRALDSESYKQLSQNVVDGKKPKNVARDFLRTKNLI